MIFSRFVFLRGCCNVILVGFFLLFKLRLFCLGGFCGFLLNTGLAGMGGNVVLVLGVGKRSNGGKGDWSGDC